VWRRCDRVDPPSDAAALDLLEIVDALSHEIDFANGIQAASLGIDSGSAFVEGIRELIATHIERLQAIHDRVNRLHNAEVGS
jgi:hypothetical protein